MLAGLLTFAALLAIGFGLFRNGTFDEFIAADEQAQPTIEDQPMEGETASDDGGSGNEPTAGGESTATGATATNDDQAEAESPEGTAVADGEDGDGTDSLVVRIEPSTTATDNAIEPATATIRTDGKLYVEGAFRTETEAEQFLRSAADVFGEAALVPDYSIDPAAPDPTVSDVVLEKPILFESGSAVIEPEYIPYLEACGDVLKLNSQIVMSVSAFTDASGNADFNLELSQQRADAVMEFYRNLDIGDDQLISTGFGEADFVADNSTEDGRQQNRRAMLELLNVMSDG